MGLRSVGMCSRCPGAANTEQRLQADPQRLAVPAPLLEATQGVKRVHTCLVKKDHGLVSSIKVKILCALPHCCSCSLYHWSVFLTWVSQLHTLSVLTPDCHPLRPEVGYCHKQESDHFLPATVLLPRHPPTHPSVTPMWLWNWDLTKVHSVTLGSQTLTQCHKVSLLCSFAFSVAPPLRLAGPWPLSRPISQI